LHYFNSHDKTNDIISLLSLRARRAWQSLFGSGFLRRLASRNDRTFIAFALVSLASLRGGLKPTKQSQGLQMSGNYYVYIITNKRNTVLYTGVTNNLKKRVYEHKEKLTDGFTKKYNITKLVYYEVFEDIESAILREKQIKAGSRQKKIDLVNSQNKGWVDLYELL
jgi:putative endonuclease